MNALVVLNTEFFPGHPTAETPSAFFMFMLCLGVPLIIGVVFTALGMGLGHKKDYAADQRTAGLAPSTPQRAIDADGKH